MNGKVDESKKGENTALCQHMKHARQVSDGNFKMARIFEWRNRVVCSLCVFSNLQSIRSKLWLQCSTRLRFSTLLYPVHRLAMMQGAYAEE